MKTTNQATVKIETKGIKTPKTHYTVDFEGVTFTRATTREYSHIVLCRNEGESWGYLGWTSRADLAEKKYREADSYWDEAVVVELVESTPEVTEEAPAQEETAEEAKERHMKEDFFQLVDSKKQFEDKLRELENQFDEEYYFWDTVPTTKMFDYENTRNLIGVFRSRIAELRNQIPKDTLRDWADEYYKRGKYAPKPTPAQQIIQNFWVPDQSPYVDTDEDDYEEIICSECNELKDVEKGTWALDKGMCEPCYAKYQG